MQLATQSEKQREVEEDLRLSKVDVVELKKDNENSRLKLQEKDTEARNVLKHLGEEITIEIDKINDIHRKKKCLLKMNTISIKGAGYKI